MMTQPTAYRTPLIPDDCQAHRKRAPHDEKLASGWAEADVIALALWLRDGGPANRLEQYRHEVVLQLRASDAVFHGNFGGMPHPRAKLRAGDPKPRRPRSAFQPVIK